MEKQSTEMVRVNTRISSALNEWLDSISRKDGIPKSTLVMLAIESYRQQLRQVSALEQNQGTLKDLFDKVEQIEKKLSSGNVVKS